MSPAVPPGDAVALTRALVRADSRNPSLSAGAPGEGEAAALLAGVLREWGFDVDVHDAAPGRPNVVARVARGGGVGGDGRSLMLNGHLDVVGIEGMTHAPFAGEERGGRIYGRGAADMKGGVAAMCAAAWRAARGGALRGQVVVAAVADEEYGSAGTNTLIARGVRADAAIVTEPTRLTIMPAHRGFAWVEVHVAGRAAHGSRYEIGEDAVMLAGLLLAELDAWEQTELPRRRTHPLLGRASLHASTVSGGTAWSTYPDACVLRFERRTLPGESADDALREIRDACDRVARRLESAGRRFVATVIPRGAQEPSDVPSDAPITRALGRALAAAGEPARVEGMSAWTDAALLNAAGIPAICFGPGDIALAHAAEEWIPVDEIERAVNVLERLIGEWCR
ncbi:MAG TPA: ArgE/DapE family deacylase [Gemmatimonadaceae bacterium]|nr:ArgE/DapE family deacylase [Gemmatimonadaceae bacterium]